MTSVDAVYFNGIVTIATTSADSTVRLWRVKPDEQIDQIVNSFQAFDLRNGICLAVKLCLVPSVGLLFAYATDDGKIQLFGENFHECFEKLESLHGHEDWVRGLDFTTDDNGDILLASSSQDSFIRIWRITPRAKETVEVNDNLIQVDERSFQFVDKKFILTLESVLQGHENWVYSVTWSRNKENNSLQLLSSSMDKTMIIWKFFKEENLWMEKLRVGDVGGNTLGFYGAKFHPNGKSIVGHGFQGSLHLWRESRDDDRVWGPAVVCGGHFKEVKDIAWEPKGDFLFSISMDQTTRIHAQWNRKGKIATYHEIARPQVHGYDMQCFALLSRYRFASAAEEKIVRTFQATGNFVENFQNLVGVERDTEGDEILKTHQKGASVPTLGLSNKAVYDDDLTNTNIDKKFKDEYPENFFVPMTMSAPPTEEYLTQNTLWPELQKLYAHGYELYSLAATKDGKLLASACKATTIEHAEIILWDTTTWKILQRLQSHKLTVTQMKFSSDGNRLLSVSRDRRWTMFENKPTDSIAVNFSVAASTGKTNGIHERIIWCCDWSHDDKYFATGSREGKVVVWTRTTEASEDSLRDYKLATTLELASSSITALSFAKQSFNGDYILAIGLDSGLIQISKFNGSSLELLRTLNHSEAHHLCVNKLEFRPGTEKYQVASCGSDNFVKIFELSL